MAKSKSKTFPKGADPMRLTNWVLEQISTAKQYTADDDSFINGTDSKYLITITKLPEKGTILSPSYFPKGMREAYGKMKAVMDYIEENKLQQEVKHGR